ncbi:MAG TPA: hypothetical protein VFZ43_03100 [Anaerolineales bacterium]
MYRSVISLFMLALLVGSVIVINPRALAEATDLWEETKPTLVAWKDKALQVVQDLIYGGPEAQIDHEPAPPELDTDLIIT